MTKLIFLSFVILKKRINNLFSLQMLYLYGLPRLLHGIKRWLEAITFKLLLCECCRGLKNYQVTWKYNLLGGQTIRFKLFSTHYGSGVRDDIGDVTGRTPVLYNRHDYMARFRLNSTSKFSTLTINTTFQCRMQDGGNTWAYNVRIEVIGMVFGIAISIKTFI